ncbi:MAG: hypothetical protein JNK74_15610 [Candidatus Hydrogenedentes bacterium]|nr:hypothetical protein [Candidatus Hydrogenedentota bacterium]
MSVSKMLLIAGSFSLLFHFPAPARDLASLTTPAGVAEAKRLETRDFSFDGYKNYWSRDAWAWNSARGLFLQSRQTPEAALWALEEELGRQFMLEELWVQPGFMKALVEREFTLLDRPAAEVFSAAPEGDLLITLTDQDALGAELIATLPEEMQFRRDRAFRLEDSSGRVFVLASHSAEELARLKILVLDTLAVLKQYDFHRGLAGVTTNHLMITPGAGHNPFDLISLARSMGCGWIMVNGYNDWMLAGPVNRALAEVQDPFVFVSGQNVTGGAMYGLERYPDVQDNTVEQCLAWAKEKGGHYFASLGSADGPNAANFQGFLLSGPGDQARIEALDAPFIAPVGDLYREAPTTMVAFLEKGAELTQQSLLAAIEGKRAVAIYPEGVVVGPKALRTAIQFLLLEGTVLSERIQGPVGVDAKFKNGALTVSVTNRTAEPLTGTLTLMPGAGLEYAAGSEPDEKVMNMIPGQTTRVLSEPFTFEPSASGRNNLVGIRGTVNIAGETPMPFHALASIKIPRVVSFHTLRYDVPGPITYPISLWNSSKATSIDLTFVVKRKDSGEEVHRTERQVAAMPWQETRESVTFTLPAGDYIVEASALGVTTTGQLALREAPGEVNVREEDLDGDGIPEVIMENDAVRVAVLKEGGRVIEYILKETGENIFFKLWPKTPPLHGTPGDTRAFYPFGGLEEFIGYPYIGGHIQYHHEIVQASGNRARVRVWANMHGSKIGKVYTLYAGGPVLEAAYEFQDMTPSIATFGINPLFELGPSTGPEDHYYFPEDSLVETRPELARYYGRACFPREGWAAGSDPEAHTSLVIGYPVNDAVYLHLWNNHPDNTPTPYYYTELQPWIQFDHGTTTYFTYYVLGSTEEWTQLLETFRSSGLVTSRVNSEPWSY